VDSLSYFSVTLSFPVLCVALAFSNDNFNISTIWSCVKFYNFQYVRLQKSRRWQELGRSKLHPSRVLLNFPVIPVWPMSTTPQRLSLLPRSRVLVSVVCRGYIVTSHKCDVEGRYVPISSLEFIIVHFERTTSVLLIETASSYK
jgi:hypothetical protein